MNIFWLSFSHTSDLLSSGEIYFNINSSAQNRILLLHPYIYK